MRVAVVIVVLVVAAIALTFFVNGGRKSRLQAQAKRARAAWIKKSKERKLQKSKDEKKSVV